MLFVLLDAFPWYSCFRLLFNKGTLLCALGAVSLKRLPKHHHFKKDTTSHNVFLVSTLLWKVGCISFSLPIQTSSILLLKMMIKGHNIVHCMRIENRGRENVFENGMFPFFFLDCFFQ